MIPLKLGSPCWVKICYINSITGIFATCYYHLFSYWALVEFVLVGQFYFRLADAYFVTYFDFSRAINDCKSLPNFLTKRYPLEYTFIFKPLTISLQIYFTFYQFDCPLSIFILFWSVYFPGSSRYAFYAIFVIQESRESVADFLELVYVRLDHMMI